MLCELHSSMHIIYRTNSLHGHHLPSLPPPPEILLFMATWASFWAQTQPFWPRYRAPLPGRCRAVGPCRAPVGPCRGPVGLEGERGEQLWGEVL